MPEKFGDSLKDFRFTVNTANEQKKVVAGLEEGRGGYGFRVVVPITYEGQHIGSMEYGSNFGNSFLEKIKQSLPGDHYIYIFDQEKTVTWNTEAGKEDQTFLYATTEEDLYGIQENVLERLKEGEFISYTSPDKSHLILLLPYADYKGQYMGYIKSVIDRSITAHIQSQTTWRTFLLMAATALVLLIAVYVMNQRLVIKPLSALDRAFQRITSGHLNEQLIEKSQSKEFSSLSHAFNQMVGYLNGIYSK